VFGDASFPAASKTLSCRNEVYSRKLRGSRSAYIEYPSGRRIELETRKALSCGCFDSSIVPEPDADILNSEPGAHFPKPSFQSSVMTPDRPNSINGDCRVFRACRT
jgi:hypothetical protein